MAAMVPDPEASGLFCNNCGHRNPPRSNFCSSCGAPLPTPGEEHTASFAPVDPSQEAPGPQDAVTVDIDAFPKGSGVLVVRSGPGGGLTFPLASDLTRLGRHPDSEVFLDDVTVSRRHVEIRRTRAGYVVRDVGSLNGTYLNGHRIDEAVLEQGDQLQVGKFKLVFMVGTDT
jgi:pSer/pThr/pTyr-binding forkhead associated (FHA) protein